MAPSQNTFVKTYLSWTFAALIVGVPALILVFLALFGFPDGKIIGVTAGWEVWVYYPTLELPVLLPGALICTLIHFYVPKLPSPLLVLVAIGVFTGLAAIVCVVTGAHVAGLYAWYITVAAGVLFGVGTFFGQKLFWKNSRQRA